MGRQKIDENTKVNLLNSCLKLIHICGLSQPNGHESFFESRKILNCVLAEAAFQQCSRLPLIDQYVNGKIFIT